MGSVYLAHDPDLDRLVAIKLLRDEYSDDPELRARFLREARLVARLRPHRNIVIIFETGEDNGRPFMAMEYVAGQTLKQFLQQTPAPPLDRRFELVEELCAGLAHAHAADIIHRDIKPANLMIDGEGVLKILDFGIARFRGARSNTIQGAMIGTFPYMSPEQAQGRELDQRSDVFAAGAILYELIALERAFTGDSDALILQKVAAGSYVPLEDRVPDVNADLAAVVRQALAREPADRFEDANAMRKALARVRRQMAEEFERNESPDRPRRLSPQRLAELRRQQVDEYLRSANEALARGDLDAALHAAERAATVDPDSKEAFDAIDRIRFEIEAKAVRQLLVDARRQLSQGRVDDALRPARQAEEAAARLPEVQGAEVLHAEVAEVAAQVAAARQREDGIRASLDRAKASLVQGRLDTALRAVYEALALDPVRPDARALEEDVQAQIRAQRERARRRALDQIQSASAIATAGRFQEALDLIELVDDPTETVRQAAAGARALVLELRRKAESAQAFADAQIALGLGAFEQAIAGIDSIPQSDLTDAARSLRATAARAIAERIEVERKRQTLNDILAVASRRLDLGDEEGAFERLQAAAALGFDDDRIVSLQQRVDERRAAAEERRQREAQDRLAAMRVASAREFADRGKLDDAIALLESHGSSHPLIQASLQEMRSARVEQEQRQREEAARREAEEARRQAEIARKRRLEEERRAAGQRQREEEERQRQQQLEQRRRDEELVTLVAAEEAAQASHLEEATTLLMRFPAGTSRDADIETRIQAVRSEIDRQQREVELARLAEEERRRNEEEARRQAAARAEAERLAASKRQADEARQKVAAEQQLAAQEAVRREAAVAAERERPARARLDRRIPAAAVVLLTLMLGIWKLWPTGPTRNEPGLSTTVDDKDSSQPPTTPPDSPNDPKKVSVTPKNSNGSPRDAGPRGGGEKDAGSSRAKSPASTGVNSSSSGSGRSEPESEPDTGAARNVAAGNQEGPTTTAPPEPIPVPSGTGLPISRGGSDLRGTSPGSPPAGTGPVDPTPDRPAGPGRGNPTVPEAETAIRQLLDEYVEAYNAMDEERVRRIDPGFTQRNLKLSFSSIGLVVSQVSIRVEPDGRTATLTAVQTFDYRSARAGRPRIQSNPGKLSWSLVKDGDGWRVAPQGR